MLATSFSTSSAGIIFLRVTVLARRTPRLTTLWIVAVESRKGHLCCFLYCVMGTSLPCLDFHWLARSLDNFFGGFSFAQALASYDATPHSRNSEISAAIPAMRVRGATLSDARIETGSPQRASRSRTSLARSSPRRSCVQLRNFIISPCRRRAADDRQERPTTSFSTSSAGIIFLRVTVLARRTPR